MGFEGFIEIAAITKAEAKGDLCDGERGICQIESGFFKAIDQNVSFKGATEHFFEHTAKIAMIHIQLICDVRGGDRLGQALAQIFHHLLHKRRFPTAAATLADKLIFL